MASRYLPALFRRTGQCTDSKKSIFENSAPTGYIKDIKTYFVEIVPHYDIAESDASIFENYNVKFYLKSEGSNTLLTINSFETSNEGETINKKVTSSEHTEIAQVIDNTPDNELPNTDVICTTML